MPSLPIADPFPQYDAHLCDMPRGPYASCMADLRPSRVIASIDAIRSMRRVGVCQFFDKPIADWAVPCARSVEKFCRSRGYVYHRPDAAPDPSRPAAWQKPEVLLAHLAEHELAWWVDADVVVTNGAIDLEKLVAGTDADIYLSRDRLGLNNGVFALRPTLASFRFLRLWRDRFPPGTRMGGDQEVFAACLAEAEAAGLRVCWLEQRAINARPDSHQPGDWLIHFAGHDKAEGEKAAMAERLLAQHAPDLLPKPVRRPPIFRAVTGVSFCVLTDGRNPDLTSRALGAIAASAEGAGIPWEIVVAGNPRPFAGLPGVRGIDVPESAERGFLGAGRNAAGDATRFDTLVFLDDDVFPEPGFVAGLVEFSRSKPWDAIGVDVLEVDGYRLHGPPLDPHDRRGLLTGAFACLRRETFARVRWDGTIPFNAAKSGGVNEDIEFSRRLRAAGIGIVAGPGRVWHANEGRGEGEWREGFKAVAGAVIPNGLFLRQSRNPLP